MFSLILGLLIGAALALPAGVWLHSGHFSFELTYRTTWTRIKALWRRE